MEKYHDKFIKIKEDYFKVSINKIFYDIFINDKCIVDIIKDIFDNNDIESSIKKSLQFLKDNEPEFGSKCTLKSK